MSADLTLTQADAAASSAAPPAPAAGGRGAASKHGGRRGEHVDLIVKRAVRRDHDDDHGGSWKVAFADFCLALMCLFLLLWVLGARDEEEARLKLGEMADSVLYDGGSGVLNGAPAPVPAAVHLEGLSLRPSGTQGNDEAKTAHAPKAADTVDSLEELAERVRALGKEAGLLDNLQTIITPMGLRIMLHDTDDSGVFVSGGATPSEPFRPLLSKLGRLMGAVGNPLLVIGHTDSVPYRSKGFGSRSNWHLSGDRAMSARRGLIHGGMGSSQVLQVVGMADRAPLADNPRAAVNRRIEFLVLTPERARTIQSMFGQPGRVVPLVNGVNAVSAGEPDAAQVGQQVGVVLDDRKI